MVHRVTTNNNEWQRVVQRVTANDKEWPWMTTNDNEGYNEWKQMRVILGFRMKQLYNVKLQCIQQHLFENIMCWYYYYSMVQQSICRSSHQRFSIKMFPLNNFAIFTGNEPKAWNFIKKRLQCKFFSCEYNVLGLNKVLIKF